MHTVIAIDIVDVVCVLISSYVAHQTTEGLGKAWRRLENNDIRDAYTRISIIYSYTL